MRLFSKGNSGPSRVFQSADLRSGAKGDGHGGILDNNPDPNLPISAEGRTMHV